MIRWKRIKTTTLKIEKTFIEALRNFREIEFESLIGIWILTRSIKKVIYSLELFSPSGSFSNGDRRPCTHTRYAG
jgi:hypothetical protein